MRSNQLKDTTLKLYRDEQNVYKTGLYVKDSIVGIGTLSFIDPNTKKYGALGHEITEKNTGQILEIKDGNIFESEVTGVERSEIGTPGEKNAKLYSDQVTGTVSKNTNQGIFGTYTSDENQMFVAEVDTPRQQITYFKLSQVNRAFSADTETLGAGTIAMRMRNDGKLEIYIKDCDQPPFGEIWWDGFEPDMFSFASTFTKVE